MGVPVYPVAGGLCDFLGSWLVLGILGVFEFESGVARFFDDIVTPYWWCVWLDYVGVGVPRLGLETETTKLVNMATAYLCFSTFLPA